MQLKEDAAEEVGESEKPDGVDGQREEANEPVKPQQATVKKSGRPHHHRGGQRGDGSKKKTRIAANFDKLP